MHSNESALVNPRTATAPVPAPRRSLRRTLLGAALAVLTAVASPAQDGSTGTVTGRVYNAGSGAYLNNARVTVEGTRIEVFTDSSGSYTLPNVPAGPANVTVSFTGQTPINQAVTVPSGGSATANFNFNTSDVGADAAAVRLDPFEVNASHFRNAMEIAMHEERTAINIKSVVSADSLGFVPDGNVGDFIRFMPGVDIEYGDGTAANPDNPVAVGVRGFGADNTAILIDGMPVASGSPSGLSRTVQLDGLSINNVSRLEIIKVATPDMPQDSPGGVINLISRGAFEFPRPTFNVTVATNINTNDYELFKKSPGPNNEMIWKNLPNIRFGGSIPFSDKFGVSFSVATDNKYSLTRNVRMRDWFFFSRNTNGTGVSAPVQNADGPISIANPVIDRFELRENQWVDRRMSGSLKFDWRPFPGLDISAGGQFNSSEDTGVMYRTQWRYSNAVGIKDWGADYVESFQRTPSFNPNLRADMTVDSRSREGFTSQGNLNVRYRKNGWNINARAIASESYTAFVDRDKGHFSSVDVTINPGRMDLSGINKGIVGEILLWDNNGNPLEYDRLSNWNQFTNSNSIVRSSEAYNRDLVKQYNLDIAKDLDFLPFPVTVKVGGMQRSKDQHKSGAGTGYRMMYTGPSIPNSELETIYSTSSLGYAQPQFWPDQARIYQLFKDNPGHFDDTVVLASNNTNLLANNYLSRINGTKGLTETTTDLFGMVTAKFFSNRMTVVTGARQSRRDNKGFNVFNNPKFNYVVMPSGEIYRDDVYTSGVKYDGTNNAGGVARDIVLTDQALRARMAAAGVAYLPSQLELAPNGTTNGNRDNNFHFAQLARYTRFVDTSLTQPWTPQAQVAYSVTDNLRLQVAWSRETRMPDLEGGDGILVGGASFEVNEATTPSSEVGGDGTIRLSNLTGEPEINTSYNFKVGYYPKNGFGQYSISYYYKIVDNAWETIDTFNTDAEYEPLLRGMGLSSDNYENYRISTVTATGIRQIRKGFEIELKQNFGFLGDWGRSWDIYANYTRRPSPTQTGGENRLGWIPRVPVRASWGAGINYAARRFSAQAHMKWVEPGISYSGGNTSVDLPDGTRTNIQLYNLNKFPPELKMQVNYALTERWSFFAHGNKVLSGRTYDRISDQQTGFMPSYATYRTMQNRGVTISAGVNSSF